MDTRKFILLFYVSCLLISGCSIDNKNTVQQEREIKKYDTTSNPWYDIHYSTDDSSSLKSNIRVLLQRAHNVTYLLSTGTEIRDITPAELQRFVNLQYLCITDPVDSANREELLRSYLSVLKDISSLRELVIHTNVKYIPAEIGNLEQVTSVEFDCQPLQMLPVEIGNMRNVERLDIRLTPVASWPDEMRSLYKLQNIDFQYKNKEDLQRKIEVLKDLPSLRTITLSREREFYLDYYEADTLPANIGTLTQIENLTIDSYCRLPDSIRKLKQLKKLQLRIPIPIEDNENDPEIREIRRLRKLLPQECYIDIL